MNTAIYIVIGGVLLGWCGQLAAFRAGYEHRKAGTKVMGAEARKFDTRGMIYCHLGFAIALGGLAYGMWG